MWFFGKKKTKSGRESWSESLTEEMDFWRSLADRSITKNKEWADNFHYRAEHDKPFPPELDEVLPASLLELSVLDVGAGPITQVGSLHETRQISITAVDPLADFYNSLLDEYSVVMNRPRTIPGEAEDLSNVAQDNAYDVVYSRNALDHSYNPISAIREMVRACKPGGICWISGSVNEGVKMNYNGLHQWNFEPRGNDNLVVWNQSESHDLLKEVPGIAKITCSTNKDDWFAATLYIES